MATEQEINYNTASENKKRSDAFITEINALTIPTEAKALLKKAFTHLGLIKF